MMKPLLIACQVDVAALTTQLVLVLTDEKGEVQVCFCSFLMNRESIWNKRDGMEFDLVRTRYFLGGQLWFLGIYVFQ